MKKMIAMLLFCLGLTPITAQTGGNTADEAAVKFLDLYNQGKWFDACKLYATPGCDDQLSFMFKKMDTDDNYVDEGKCTVKIDTCIIGKDKNTAQCFYTKTCSGLKKPAKHVLNLVLQNGRWYVEYIWKRDRYI